MSLICSMLDFNTREMTSFKPHLHLRLFYCGTSRNICQNEWVYQLTMDFLPALLHNASHVAAYVASVTDPGGIPANIRI